MGGRHSHLHHLKNAVSGLGLDAALQVWACALKGQLSQVIKVSSVWGLRLARGFCSSISCHWSLTLRLFPQRMILIPLPTGHKKMVYMNEYTVILICVYFMCCRKHD